MTTELLIEYSVSDAAIAELDAAYAGLFVEGVEDRDGLRLVHDARMVVKGHRVAVEKTRVALKKDALEYGRRVDGEAKRLTGLLSPIEERLQGEENVVAQEQARIKREAEEAERARLQERLDALSDCDHMLVPQDVADMDDNEFDEELALGQHNQRMRQKEEEARKAEAKAATIKRAEEEARLREEREKLEAEQAAARQADEERAREAQEAAAANRAEMEAERQKLQQEREELAREREERERAFEVERQRAELDLELPARERVQAWLVDLQNVELPICPWREEILALRLEYVEGVEELLGL